MLIELKNAGLDAKNQLPIKVFYDQHLVGQFTADILVNDAIIVELKSIRLIVAAHEVRLVNYLAATGKEVGLILNFAERNVSFVAKLSEFWF